MIRPTLLFGLAASLLLPHLAWGQWAQFRGPNAS